MLLVSAMHLMAAPARAVIICTWVGCADPPEWCLFDFCWCEGSWGDSGNWYEMACGTPNGSSDKVIITHYNSDATVCQNPPSTESWTQINVVTSTFCCMEIKSVCTEGAGEALCIPETFRLIFWGSQTLTTNGSIRIDGVDGQVIVEVGAGAVVKTQ